jgi:tetratricopeptide (TPR) repeat protein/transposase-like protein
MKKEKRNSDFRLEVVKSAIKVGISTTARAFEVNRKTVYRWLKRYETEGVEGLKTRTRSNFDHSQKMPIEIENKIITYKRNNPRISAKQIICDLNIEYSLPTVIKKLRNANLVSETNNIRIDQITKSSHKPFQLMFFSVNKIAIKEYKKRFVYCYTATDHTTGFIFHSFAEEISKHNFIKFLQYLYSNLDSINMHFLPRTLIPVRRTLLTYCNSKKAGLLESSKKFGIMIKSIEDIEMTIKNKVIKKEVESIISNMNAKESEQIILQSTILFDQRNSKCLNKHPDLSKQVIMIHPVHLDKTQLENHQVSLANQTFNTKSFQHKLISKLINLTSSKIENCDFELAADYADLTLQHLEFYQQQKIQLSEILLLKAIIAKNLTTMSEAKIFYERALKIANESSNYKSILKAEMAIADFYMLANKYIVCEKHLLKAINIAKQNKLTEKEVINARLLAMTYLKMGQVEKGLRILNVNWQKIKNSHNIKLVIEYLISLVIFQEHKGNQLLSEKYLRRVNELTNSIQDSHFLSMAYFNMINHYLAIDNFKICRLYINKLQDLIPRLSIVAQIQKSFNILGVAFTELHEYETALKYFLKELQVSETHGMKVSVMSSNINIACLYLIQDKYAEALNRMKQSLIIAKKINNKKGLLIISINIAEILFLTEKYDQALTHLDEYLPLAKENNSAFILYGFYNTYFRIYFTKNNFNSALIFAQKTLVYTKKMRDYRNTVSIINKIGAINLELKKFRCSIINLNKAERIAKENGYTDLLAEIKLNKAEYYLILKKNSEADFFFKEALSLANEINASELTVKIENFGVKLNNKNLGFARKAFRKNNKSI